MHKMTGWYLIAAVAFTASAEPVNISGTVTNKNGQPISGAIITLPSQNMADTADADGRYSINGQAMVNQISILPSAENISLSKGIILLSLTKPAPVKIEMFDIKGKLLGNEIDNNASAGSFRFDLLRCQLAARMMMIRVSIGRRASTFRYIPLSMGKRSVRFSGSQNGFGGDLRFGKTGPGAGLLGADSICQCIAERSMPGSKVKQWRAFLSVAQGPNGQQVNASERIGQGPWFDRVGRLLAPTLADLLHPRPENGDSAIRNDLPNENGVPNRRPDPSMPEEDNHHFITGSDTLGKLYALTATCQDWTSTTSTDKPRCGFSWPRDYRGGGILDSSAIHWISGWNAGGCSAGICIDFMEGKGQSENIIGNHGGYGGFYCFALKP